GGDLDGPAYDASGGDGKASAADKVTFDAAANLDVASLDLGLGRSVLFDGQETAADDFAADVAENAEVTRSLVLTVEGRFGVDDAFLACGLPCFGFRVVLR